jgi:plastocyanin
MKNADRRQFLKMGLGIIAVPLAAKMASAASHATHVVEIKGHKFNPATLTMQAGDKVQFINMDGAPHTATADNGAFDTGRLKKGQDATVQIKTAGTHSYFCAVHPSMKGKVVAG